MVGHKNRICRLCLKKVTGNKYKWIKDVTRDILEVISLELVFGNTGIHVICIDCYTKSLAAFQFKSTCLYTEDVIFPYINCNESSQLDLREIYVKEKAKQQLIGISNDQGVCRFCMQPTKGDLNYMQGMDVNMITKFLPELKINIIKDPIICETCFVSFSKHTDFLKSCLDVVEKVKKTRGKAPLKAFKKRKGTDLKRDEEERDGISVEAARTTDVPQENEPAFYKNFASVNNRIRKACGKPQAKLSLNNEDIKTKVNESEQTQTTHNNASLKLSETSNEIKLEEESKEILIVSSDISQDNEQESVSTKNETFNYENRKNKTKGKDPPVKYKTPDSSPQNPPLKHTESSDSRVYICNECQYETTRRCNFIRHLMKHKDSSEVRMHKCTKCKFQSKYIDNLKLHQLLHKKPSELKMYKCDRCDYVTKRTDHLRQHKLKHEDLLEVKIYKCDKCRLRTKYKRVYMYHMIKHENTSEMYKCDQCPYVSKIMVNFKAHLKIHNKTSEVQIYKCDDCSFQTKRKDRFKGHRFKHKRSPEDRVYKCANCNYESCNRECFISHQKVHRDLAKVQIYKCDKCGFMTQHKQSLKKHQSGSNRCK